MKKILCGLSTVSVLGMLTFDAMPVYAFPISSEGWCYFHRGNSRTQRYYPRSADQSFNRIIRENPEQRRLERELAEARAELARVQAELQAEKRNAQLANAPIVRELDETESAPREDQLMALRRSSSSMSNLKALKEKKW